MGTSSSYKGSKSSSWRIARELFAELPTDGVPDQGSDSQSTLDESPAAQAAAAIAQALIADNPAMAGARHNFSMGGLLAGGGASGGGARSVRQKASKSGKQSHHQAVTGAARGAVAIQAAYGLRNGDNQRLQELGLNLTDLQALRPAQQCAAIAEAVFGDTNNPNDAALKRATIEHLKDILLAEQPLSIEDTIRNFIADWIFQLGLIELKAANNEQPIPALELGAKETQIKAWLKRTVQSLHVDSLDGLSNRRLANETARLVQKTLKMVEAARR